MSHQSGVTYDLDAGVIALALEAATLLSTLEAGSRAEELGEHARLIDDALAGIETTLARSWMAATAQSLRHAALYAAARPDLDPGAVARMDARMAAIAQSQIAIVLAMARPTG